VQVLLVDGDNNVQGAIFVPSDVLEGAGTLTVQPANLAENVDTKNIGSVVLNITLTDSAGNEKSQLDDSVEVCLQVKKSSKDVRLLFVCDICYLLLHRTTSRSVMCQTTRWLTVCSYICLLYLIILFCYASICGCFFLLF
jgi:hypothetical protein